MAYTRRSYRRRTGLRRRRYSRRNYGRYRRTTRYRTRSTTLARRAYSKARYALRKARRISKTLDYQIYYNYTTGTAHIYPDSTTVVTTADTASGPGFCQQANLMPKWIKGGATLQAAAGTQYAWNTFNAIPSLGVGPKGWGLNTVPYAFVQGDRMRIKNFWIRFNIEYCVNYSFIAPFSNTTSSGVSGVNNNNPYVPPIKCRLVVFTYNDTEEHFPIGNPTTGTSSWGYFDITAIQSANTTSTGATGTASQPNATTRDVNIGQQSRVYPTNAQKIPGVSKLRKIYDKFFVLNSQKYYKKINVNCYRRSILKFPIDDTPTDVSDPAVMTPLQKVAYCLLIDWPMGMLNSVTQQQESNFRQSEDFGNIMVNWQSLVRYYDQ